MSVPPHIPSPEALIQERLRVSIIELITEARAMMRGASQEGDWVQAWRQVISWLESKLPEGIAVVDLDDPMLSPALNARLREERHGHGD